MDFACLGHFLVQPPAVAMLAQLIDCKLGNGHSLVLG
jgi:hypothetical protein